MTDPATPTGPDVAAPPPPSLVPSPEKEPGRGYRVALLVVAVAALLVGAGLLLSGLTPVPEVTDLGDLGTTTTALGVHIRDQVAGAAVLFVGAISFLLWLTTGALRHR